MLLRQVKYTVKNQKDTQYQNKLLYEDFEVGTNLYHDLRISTHNRYIKFQKTFKEKLMYLIY